MFDADGLHITTQGYFYARWNSDTESYLGKRLSLQEIETHLGSTIYLAPDVRLKHVLLPVIKSEVFPVVFKRHYWREICDEILATPWKSWVGDSADKSNINGEEIEYLEVYEQLDYSEVERELYNVAGQLGFHGMGYASSQAHKKELDLGSRTPYSLSGSSMAEYMNHPIRIGKIGLMITQAS